MRTFSKRLRPYHKVVKGMKSKVQDWRRYYIFVELSEIYVSDRDVFFYFRVEYVSRQIFLFMLMRLL